MSSNTEATLITAVIGIVLAIALMFGVNACSAPKWNDGVCPDCSVRYELRGVSKQLKYYVCPKCGQEVERY